MSAKSVTIESPHPPWLRERVPTISVLLPVYNAEAYLATALDAILRQTWGDFELICVDDGSTDDSLAILRRRQWHDERIRVISRANTGIVGALNDGLAEARGRYIARMDADDWCAPQRLALQTAYLDDHPECVAVGSWVKRMDPYGCPIGTQEPPLDHDAIDAALLMGDGSVLVHATLLMRADALRAINGWQARFNWVEDLDLFLRLAERGRVANLPRHLYWYRRHPQSVCSRNYTLMCERLKQVLREAYTRRGISERLDFSRIRPELWGDTATSVAQMFRDWACHAIHSGNRRIARKHACEAVRREPWSPRSWKVLYWSLAA